MRKDYLNKETMIADGIKYVVHGKPPEPYFSVAEVKEKYPDALIRGANVYQLEIEGSIVPTVKAADIEEMSSFDKLLMQTKKFPKK